MEEIRSRLAESLILQMTLEAEEAEERGSTKETLPPATSIPSEQP